MEVPVKLACLVFIGGCLLGGGSGCRVSKQPYEKNPLYTSNRSVVMNPIQCEPVETWVRPTAPPPPSEAQSNQLAAVSK
jgi:hypothetical protein